MKKLILIGAFFLLALLGANQQAEAQYYGGGGGFGRGGIGNGFPQAGQSDNRRRDNTLDPEEIAKEDTRWMTKKLKLTEEQIPKVEDINIKYAFQRFDIFEELKKATNNGTTAPPDDVRTKLREKMRKMKDDKDNDMKAVLTPEQFEEYQKRRKDS